MFQSKNSSSIRANGLFEGTDKNLKLNINQKDFVEKKEGEILFRNGDPSDYLYLIVEGEVKLKITGVFSSPVIVKHGKNEFFGEKELLENSKRTSSAVANTHCLLYRMNLNTINNLINKNKIFKRNLYKTLNIDEPEENALAEGQKEFFIKAEDSTQKFKIPEKKEKKEEPERTTEPEDGGTEPGIESIEAEPGIKAEEFTNELIAEDFEQPYNEVTEPAQENNLIESPTEKEAIIYVDTPKDEELTSLYDSLPEENLEDDEENLAWDFTSVDIDELEELVKEPENISETPEENKQADEDDKLTFEDFTRQEIGQEIAPEETVMSGIEAFTSDEAVIPEINQENKTNGLTVEEKNNILKQFSGLISSDIKYPLLTLKFYAEQIKKRDISKELNEVVDLLIEQANIISDAAEALNNFAENKVMLSAEPITINAALDEILGILADYIESMGSKLLKKYETTALVNIDKGKLYQAVYQITKNACEAMPEGGNIYISSSSDENFVKIEIKNKGKSIPLEIREKIFEPYFSYGKENAAGLGLSIASKIIKDHNGSILVDEDDEGTSFTITIPVFG